MILSQFSKIKLKRDLDISPRKYGKYATLDFLHETLSLHSLGRGRGKFHFWTSFTTHFTIIGSINVRYWPETRPLPFIDLEKFYQPPLLLHPANHSTIRHRRVQTNLAKVFLKLIFSK